MVSVFLYKSPIRAVLSLSLSLSTNPIPLRDFWENSSSDSPLCIPNMVLESFDSVKAEKAMAMRNYRRRRKLQWATAFSVCLFFVSPPSSWLFSFLPQVFRQLVVVFNSHVCVFLFFNAMIFVVYSLSGLEKERSVTDRIDGIATAGEFLDRSDHSADEKRTAREKDVASPAGEVAITAISEDEDTTSPIRHSEPTSEVTEIVSETILHRRTNYEGGEEIVSETKRYRRTQSERCEHRETNKFRRSNTDICGDLATVGGERRRVSCSVNEMDLEDFNRTIESFIAEQKWHQREESREERITDCAVLAMTFPSIREERSEES